MKTVPLLIINRSDRNAKHRIDQVLHSNVISLGNRVLIKDIRPNCTVSSWRRQCCGCPQNPSVQHTFQFKTPLSSTPKTPQFNTPLNSTPKTPHFNTENPSVPHQKPLSSTHPLIPHRKLLTSTYPQFKTPQFNTKTDKRGSI